MENNRIQKENKERYIVFDGISDSKNGFSYMSFTLISDQGERRNSIKIPVDTIVAEHVMRYLGKIAAPETKSVERSNDDDSA